MYSISHNFVSDGPFELLLWGGDPDLVGWFVDRFSWFGSASQSIFWLLCRPDGGGMKTIEICWGSKSREGIIHSFYHRTSSLWNREPLPRGSFWIWDMVAELLNCPTGEGWFFGPSDFICFSSMTSTSLLPNGARSAPVSRPSFCSFVDSWTTESNGELSAYWWVPSSSHSPVPFILA